MTELEEQALTLLAECISQNMVLNYKYNKPELENLLSYELNGLILLSKNKPKSMCRWLGSYMREKGLYQ